MKNIFKKNFFFFWKIFQKTKIPRSCCPFRRETNISFIHKKKNLSLKFWAWRCNFESLVLAPNLPHYDKLKLETLYKLLWKTFSRKEKNSSGKLFKIVGPSTQLLGLALRPRRAWFLAGFLPGTVGKPSRRREPSGRRKPCRRTPRYRSWFNRLA